MFMYFMEIQVRKCISIYNLLLKPNKIVPFLKQLIIDDKKWLVYNVNRKRSLVNQNEPTQTTPKGDIYQKKKKSVRRDYKGILHFELLPNVYVQ